MSSKKDKIIFLIQAFEQPRILKIILDKSKEYEHVHVYGFTRKIHAVENYKILDNNENIKYQIVSTIEDGKYWKRLIAYLKLIVIIYKKYGFIKKHLYVVGLDLRILCVLIFNKYIEYVISDIAWLYYPKPFSTIFGKIDQILSNYSDKVLMTSRGFYNSYYKKYVSEEQLVLTENKLATYNRVFPLKELKSDKIRIAYVGAFRYGKIITNLLNVVKNNKNLELNFYGDGFSEIVTKMKEHAATYDNIFFNGAFKNPDDLQNIYANSNVNFVIYNNTLANERVAMPNKFYESGFFNIPILCATNTYVGQRALELNMGWVCDISEEEIYKFFNNLSIDDILKKHENIKELDKSLFNY